MPNTSETMREIVHSAIAALNEELPEGERIAAEGQTRLVGPRGVLSSLQVVNLVIHVEEGIAERVGVDLDLTVNEELFAQDGPLKTVDAFVSYLSGAVSGGNE